MAHYVRHIMKKFALALPAPWCLEAAARLSQLGCITLEGELMRRAYAGGELNKEEQAAFDAHPQAAMELLKDIPRLEPAAWIIGQQLKREISATEVEFAGFSATDLLLGAQILKLAVAYEQLRTKIPAKNTILTRLRERKKEFESNLIDTLIDLEPDGAPKQLRKVLTSRLRTGMILDQEIKNVKGVVLVAKGQEVTSTLIIRLENHANAGAIDREVMAYVPM
jgi:HD domain